MPDHSHITNEMSLAMVRPFSINKWGSGLVIGARKYGPSHTVTQVYRRIHERHLSDLNAATQCFNFVGFFVGFGALGLLVGMGFMANAGSVVGAFAFWQLFALLGYFGYLLHRKHREDVTYLLTSYCLSLEVLEEESGRGA